MPYLTSGEQIGMEKGLQQMVLEALDERFGILPVPVSDAIHQIQDQEQL